jgi:hypothetical protein
MHVGPHRAAQIRAALEVGRRLVLASAGEPFQIRSPTDAATLLMAEMGHLDQEELRTVLLSTKNEVQAIHTVYVGSLNSAVIRVGEVFKEAVRRNSAALMVRWMGRAATLDPRPGGIYRCDINGKHIARGEYREVVPFSKIVFSFGWQGGDTPAPGQSTVEILLTPDGDGTHLRLRHHGLDPAERSAKIQVALLSSEQCDPQRLLCRPL